MATAEPDGVLGRTRRRIRGASKTAQMARKLRELKQDAEWHLDTAEHLGESVAEDRFSSETRVGRAAQTGTVLTVVTLGITIILGILIYSEVQSALPSPSNSELNSASKNATGTFADAMELAPVIMIVLLAAVVLAVVQRFR